MENIERMRQDFDRESGAQKHEKLEEIQRLKEELDDLRKEIDEQRQISGWRALYGEGRTYLSSFGCNRGQEHEFLCFFITSFYTIIYIVEREY